MRLHRLIAICELHNGTSPVFFSALPVGTFWSMQNKLLDRHDRSVVRLAPWLAPSTNDSSSGTFRCFNFRSSRSQPSLPFLAPVRYVHGWYSIYTMGGRVGDVMSRFHSALSTLGVVICLAEQATAAPNLTVYTRSSKCMGGPGYDGCLFWYTIAVQSVWMGRGGYGEGQVFV